MNQKKRLKPSPSEDGGLGPKKLTIKDHNNFSSGLSEVLSNQFADALKTSIFAANATIMKNEYDLCTL